MLNAVQLTDMTDAVERNTHSDLELSGGKVNTRHHLGRRVLDLKTRVELKEIEDILCVAVKVYLKA